MAGRVDGRRPATNVGHVEGRTRVVEVAGRPGGRIRRGSRGGLGGRGVADQRERSCPVLTVRGYRQLSRTVVRLHDGRRADPAGAVGAQLTGTAAGYAQVRRCTRGEALAELERVLRSTGFTPDSEQARQLLSRAAAMYVAPTGPGDEFWYSDALELLVEAGADTEQATAIRASRVGTVRIR